MEEWLQNPVKSHAGGSIFWKVVVKSMDVIEDSIAWMIRNGRKLRVGEDQWIGCIQQHKLRDDTVVALRQRGIFFIYQLAGLEQLYRWEQSWIRARDLGLTDPETRDLDRYIGALLQD